MKFAPEYYSGEGSSIMYMMKYLIIKLNNIKLELVWIDENDGLINLIAIFIGDKFFESTNK